MCGARPTSKLVEDHDHETGLTRGYLCRGCNHRESRGPSRRLFDDYRSRPPTEILGLLIYYGKYRLPPVGPLATLIADDLSALRFGRTDDQNPG